MLYFVIVLTKQIAYNYVVLKIKKMVKKLFINIFSKRKIKLINMKKIPPERRGEFSVFRKMKFRFKKEKNQKLTNQLKKIKNQMKKILQKLNNKIKSTYLERTIFVKRSMYRQDLCKGKFSVGFVFLFVIFSFLINLNFVSAADTTPPTVNLTYSSNPAKVGIETITATYSKAITTVPNISINQPGSTDITTQAMTSAGGNVYTFNYTVVAANGSTYVDGATTVSLSATTDAVGNISSAPTNNTFTIDTTGATPAITYSSNPTKVGTETITATYAEPIISAPTISINQPGTTDISNATMNNAGGSSWAIRTASAANGWSSVTYGNGVFVAVSANGTNRVMTSVDGTTWIAATAAEANTWNSVIFGNGLFVAVSGDGTHRAMTSTDGITWTAQTAISGNWFSVTYGNNLFVASGDGKIMTSPDGITWTARTATSAYNWRGVTFGNNLFVASAYDSIMTSPDGITWTARTAVTGTNLWYSVVYGNGTFVAVSQGGTNRVMTSPDGTTWTARTATETNTWNSVTFGNGLFVAVSGDGTNRVMTSSDGITWTAKNVASTNGWSSAVYGNGIFVVVANSASGLDRVMTAPAFVYSYNYIVNNTTGSTYIDGSANVSLSATADLAGNVSTAPTGNTFTIDTTSPAVSITYSKNPVGVGTNIITASYSEATATAPTISLAQQGSATITNATMVTPASVWTARSASEANTWSSVAYGNGVFVAVSSDGTHRVMTSSDGITWTARSAAEANTWNSVTYGNNLFVAVSSGGNGSHYIMTSPDGITWTVRTAAESNGWVAVTYGNNLFVAVSYDGVHRVMTSPDGITWTSQTAASVASWRYITYGNGIFVAFSNNGDVMISPDGITWITRIITSKNWSSVTYGNGLFLVVASGTSWMATSPDGINWIMRYVMPSYAGTGGNWSSVTYGNGLFAAVASFRNSNLRQIATSPDGITWTSQTETEAIAWSSVTYGNGIFVAVAGSGINRVMTSPAGYTYNYTVNQANGSTYKDGTATVSLSSVNDLAGNAAGVPINNTFEISTVGANVALTYSKNPAGAGVNTITATYSKAITTVPNISIDQPGTVDVATQPMISAGGNVYTYSYTVVKANSSTYIDGTTNVSLSSTVDSLGNVSMAPTGTTFVTDTTNPTAGITYSINHAVKSGDSQIITATFSKAIADAPVPQIAISGSNTLALTNMTKVDATHYTYTHTIGAGNGISTITLNTGTDLAGNIITTVPTSGATFVIDNILPTASIATICSTSGNGCTVAGQNASPQESYMVHTIGGTAGDEVSGSGLNAVNISIKDTTTSKWYNGSTFTSVSENYLGVTGTTTWSYDNSIAPLTIGDVYLINIKVLDGALNQTIVPLTFKFTNSPPTVSNVIASENSTGLVTVGYDVTDIESTQTTNSLFYKVGTLSGGISNSDSSITLSDGTYFPTTGTILIDDEMITYTSKIVNTLGGLVRGAISTTAFTHNANADVYLKANSATGNGIGLSNKGTGKNITWQANADADGFENATEIIKVVANDGAAGSMIGSAISPSFILDAKKPTAVVTFDAGVAGATNSATITIPMPTDISALQYKISDDAATETNPKDTGWVSIVGATTIPWTFDSDIEAKTIKYQYRDSYGNISTEQTTATQIPVPSSSFIVQDTSNLSIPSYDMYIGWQAASVNGFASYKLEKATSNDNITYSTYQTIVDASFSVVGSNYYVYRNLDSSKFYRFRLSVIGTNGNNSVRSNSYITTKPDGVQNYGEGVGGSVATASKVENVVVTQNVDKTVTVNYKLTDTSVSKKVNPTYEGYLFYNIGIILPENSFSNNSLTLSDASKLKSSGYIQINNEVIKYTGKNGNILTGLVRGTWPTDISNGRATRTDTIFFAGTPVWIMANGATPIAISNMTISAGQNGTIAWNTYNETNLAGSAYPNTGIKVLVHDNQDAGSGPLSTQNDFSENGILSSLDLTAPVLNFSTTSSFGLESVTPVTLTLNLARAYPLDTTVSYSLTGTATSGSDYTLSAGTATILAGQTTANISIPIINDTLKESDETIIVTLSNPLNAILGTSSVYTYTITDDDNLPTLQFTNASLSGLESVTNVNIPINLSESTGTSTTVDYSISGTASGSLDYTLANGTLTIPKGETNTNISLPIINDTLKEGDETVIITLSNVVGAILGTNSIFTYTITDDDSLPTIGFTNTNSSGLENISSVDIPITIPAIYPEDITVAYSVIGGSAEGNGVDYTLDDGIATIKAGTTSTNINLSIVDDTISEVTETIEIKLANPTNSILGTNFVYTYSILDNEIAVTAISGSEIKSTSAVITWTTSDYATSVVSYGKTLPEPDATYDLTKISQDMVLSHRVYLSNLTPATKYFFKTESTNLAGDITTSTSDFTTNAGPVLSLVSSGNITDTQSTITWTTDIPATSRVIYFTKLDLSDATTLGNDELVNSHSVNLTPFEAVKTYYFKVESSDALVNGNIGEESNSEAYYTFTTLSDMTPPKITEISAPLISSASVAVIWKTNEQADGQILYGKETGVYNNNTTLNTSLVLNHIATIDGLIPTTNYYYVVKSKDLNGNLATSNEQVVKTTEEAVVVARSGVLQEVYDALSVENEANKAKLKAQKSELPIISNITVSEVTAFGATINFDTDKDTIAFVDYGKETNVYLKTEGDSVWNKKHAIKLTGLNFGTDYYLKVKAVDKFSNLATSDEKIFKTKFFTEDLSGLTKIDNIEQFQAEIESTIESILPSLVPPFIEKPVISGITESSAVVTFKTNIKSYPIVNYTTDVGFDITKEKPYDGEMSDTTGKNLVHTLQLIGLKPNTKYHVMAKAFSFPQVIGKSEDISFSTAASKIKASVVDRKNDSFTVVWTTDDPTSSIVEYKNTKNGRTDKMTDAAKNTSHSVKVENLIPGTTYEVTVSGINNIGNMVEGGEPIMVNTSTDVVPPVISNFKVDSALVIGRTDRTQTIVSWTTDEPATSVVTYEEGSGSPDKALANKKDDAELTVSHVVILTTLKPGTVYRFQVASTDDANNITKLPIRTIITPRPNESIVDVIFKNFDETFNFLKNVK